MRPPLSGPVLLLAIVVSTAFGQEPPVTSWPTDGWRRSTPAAEGLDPKPLEALVAAVDAGTHGCVDRLFVARFGRCVLDRTWQHDYRALGKGKRLGFGWGEGAEPIDGLPPEFNYLDADRHPYRKDTQLHTLQSVTKSVTALLVGIAMSRGAIKGTERRLLEFFPDRDLAKVDPRLRQATLADVLTMRSGIEWHET